MGPISLRGGRELDDPLATVLEFVAAYPGYDSQDADANSFDERDLRLANRGGARISADEQGAILERREKIEGALRGIGARCLATGLASPVGRADAVVRRLWRDPRSRLLEDDEGGAQEAPRPDPDPRQCRAGLPGDRGSTRLLRGARDRPRSQLQARPRSQPCGAAFHSARARDPRPRPHRGAYPRHPDLGDRRYAMSEGRIETFLYDADGNRTDDESLAVRAEIVEL